MASGGSRPGAGRPKKGEKPVSDDVISGCESTGMNPLEYMLHVMNDLSADDGRRDRMAQAAAPYVHRKADETGGKKNAREEKAKDVFEGKFRPRVIK